MKQIKIENSKLKKRERETNRFLTRENNQQTKLNISEREQIFN